MNMYFLGVIQGVKFHDQYVTLYIKIFSLPSLEGRQKLPLSLNIEHYHKSEMPKIYNLIL